MTGNGPEQARILYASIISADDVLRLIRQREREGQFLEFKTTAQPMNDFDKKNLSKSLSGFANSGGGVVIWGVRTKKSDGGDQARAPQADLDAVTLADEIQRRLANSVEPLVPGVLVQPLPRRLRGRIGFVKMLIRESDARPHRGLLADERHYYQRSGAEFHIISHAVLRDMFAAARTPSLTCRLANPSERDEPVVRKRHPTGDFRARLWIVVQNEGRGTAQYPSVEMAFSGSNWNPSEIRLRTPNNEKPGPPLWSRADMWKLDRSCQVWRWDGGAHFVVHAGCELRIGYWETQVSPARVGECRWHCRLMAENMTPRELELSVQVLE